MYTRIGVACPCGYTDAGRLYETLFRFKSAADIPEGVELPEEIVLSEDPTEAPAKVRCPGRNGQCGRPLTPKRLRTRYPLMFRTGEVRTVHLAPETLALPGVNDYPIKALHGVEVTVLEDGPDNEGLVDIQLPEPYTYEDKRGVVHTLTQLPILYGVLE